MGKRTEKGRRGMDWLRYGRSVFRICCICGAASLCLVLSGCTARELEERRFPLVLELSARDGELIFSCGWPYAGGAQEEEGAPDEKGNIMEEGRERQQAEEYALDEAGNIMEEEGADQQREDGKKRQNEKTEAINNSKNSENVNKEWVKNDEKITSVKADTVEEAVKKIQNLQDKYVDYSQVKAVLWEDSMKQYPELEQQILDWMEKTPDFARNLLIFHLIEGELSLDQVQKRSQGQPGIYLENLYRNNEQIRGRVKTLEEVLYMH